MEDTLDLVRDKKGSVWHVTVTRPTSLSRTRCDLGGEGRVWEIAEEGFDSRVVSYRGLVVCSKCLAKG